MIQFTTITLLYSFASSLGDFEVNTFLQDNLGVPDRQAQFLYIDLFIIIPVAVTSKLAVTSDQLAKC